MAVGFLQLSIDEFEAMTPREFEWKLDAEHDRERRARLRTAQLACWVMNPWLKQPMKVGDLIPLRPEEEPQIDWTEGMETQT